MLHVFVCKLCPLYVSRDGKCVSSCDYVNHTTEIGVSAFICEAYGSQYCPVFIERDDHNVCYNSCRSANLIKRGASSGNCVDSCLSGESIV